MCERVELRATERDHGKPAKPASAQFFDLRVKKCFIHPIRWAWVPGFFHARIGAMSATRNGEAEIKTMEKEEVGNSIASRRRRNLPPVISCPTGRSLCATLPCVETARTNVFSCLSSRSFTGLPGGLERLQCSETRDKRVPFREPDLGKHGERVNKTLFDTT